ncbi:MAG: tetrahydromethanopterin S-methyltransferase subunit F [Moritella dasanensis]|jgi:tetrahydromethanopterin S-methyltransferase subunit F
MLRHYYIIDSLDELEMIEHELQSLGIDKGQIHTLTNDDKSLGKHYLYQVDNSLKKGLIKSGDIGAAIGIMFAITILLLTYIQGWYLGPLGGMPIIMFALMVLVFCTWEGDHIDIQLPNINSKVFKQSLENGKTILFIDLEQQQELTVNKIMLSHPMLKPEGITTTTPEWLLQQQKKFRSLLK